MNFLVWFKPLNNSVKWICLPWHYYLPASFLISKSFSLSYKVSAFHYLGFTKFFRALSSIRRVDRGLERQNNREGGKDFYQKSFR